MFAIMTSGKERRRMISLRGEFDVERKVMEFEIYLPMLQSPRVGKKFTARGDRKTKG